MIDAVSTRPSSVQNSLFDGSNISFQDVLIEYAKTDGDASIVQDPDDPNNQLILKSTAKQVNKCLFSQATHYLWFKWYNCSYM